MFTVNYEGGQSAAGLTFRAAREGLPVDCFLPACRTATWLRDDLQIRRRRARSEWIASHGVVYFGSVNHPVRDQRVVL